MEIFHPCPGEKFRFFQIYVLKIDHNLIGKEVYREDHEFMDDTFPSKIYIIQQKKRTRKNA